MEKHHDDVEKMLDRKTIVLDTDRKGKAKTVIMIASRKVERPTAIFMI